MLDDHCVFISILACQNVFSQQERDREGESDSFVCLSVFAAEYPYMHWADRLPPDLGTVDEFSRAVSSHTASETLVIISSFTMR